MSTLTPLRRPGLPALVVTPIPGARSVGVVLVVRVGSRSDPEGMAGMAHLLEHMVFQGTRLRPDPMSIVAALDRVGGDLNAHTDRECTTFSAHVPVGHLRLAIEVIADLATGALLRASDLRKEREVVHDEIAVYEDSPEELVQDMLRADAWQGHPLAHTELGSVESLERITARDLRAFMRQHFGWDRMVLGVAGCTTQEEVLQAAAAVPWPTGGPPQQQAPPGPVVRGLRCEQQDTEEVHLALAVRSPPQQHPDLAPLLLANDLLGGSMVSRLFHELREARGLVYGVDSEIEALTDAGLWSVSTSVRPRHAAEALRAVGHELRRLAAGDVGPDDLEHARGHLIGSGELALEPPQHMADWQARTLCLQGRIPDIPQRRAKYEAVTLEGLHKACATYLDPSRCSLALVGPVGSSQAMERALLGGWGVL